MLSSYSRSSREEVSRLQGFRDRALAASQLPWLFSGAFGGSGLTSLRTGGFRLGELRDSISACWVTVGPSTPSLKGSKSKMNFGSLQGLRNEVFSKQGLGFRTKHHKFLQCPALRHVRDGCEELLREVEEEWPHWIHAPYVAMPENLEVNRLVFATRALLMPSAVELDIDKIGTRPFLRMFTDGSCRHPGVPDASYAGFAVILDTSPCDASIPGILHQWLTTGCPPNEFRVLCQGSVPGLQSINRAEVCAVIQAIRLAVILRAPACEIWTDSAFAISEFERAQNSLAGTWPDLCSLLRRLPLEQVNLRKIASHQDLSKLWGMEQWFAAGNSAADVAAKSAVGRELQCVQDIAAAAADCVHRKSKLLPAFWKYLLQVSAEEMRLLRALDVPDAPAATPLAGSKPEAWLALNRGPFQAWSVPDFQHEWLLACSWPPWFTVPVWSWVRNLQWTILPPRGRAPPGVAYIELLTDFVYKFGLLPPAGLLANRDTLLDETSLLVEPTTLRQLNHSLVEAVRQLERLSGVPVWPQRRNKVFSLRELGCKEPRIGLCLRPLFEQSEGVLHLLQQVLRSSSVEPLRAFCRGQGNTPSSDSGSLQRAWTLISDNARANMARSLRRSR